MVAGTTKPSLVVVAGQHASDDLADAIEAAGAHVAERLDWDDVVSFVSYPARPPIFVLEAMGVAQDRLAAALPHINELVDTLPAAAILSIDEARIDVAAATLLGPRTQILCDPTLADRVGSLAVAMRLLADPPLVSDVASEGEGARLEKLNEEVARIAEVLARLTRQSGEEAGSRSAAVNDRRMTFGAPPGAELLIEPGEVRRAIRARRMRDQFFGSGLFEEPGWDMILDLFAAELERTRVSVSSLCIAAAVAPTTALRWISKLVDAGLFERHPDPFDRRRAYMELSPQASEAMRHHVGALRRAGLTLA